MSAAIEVAERALLGILLLEAENTGFVDRIRARVPAGDFFGIEARVLRLAIDSIREKGLTADLSNLRAHLQAEGTHEAAGGVEHLSEILEAGSEPGNVEYFVHLVREHAERRRAVEEERSIRDGLASGTLQLPEAIARFQKLAGAPGTNGREPFPGPMGMQELLAVEDPEESWLVPGFLPTAANILLVAYPKSYKTFFLLSLFVSLASGRSFLGAFPPAGRFRVGLILMEDQAHRVRRRIERICQADGINPRSLDGWLYLWFRPPLRLDDPRVMAELAARVEEKDLHAVALDSYGYASHGDSNNADEVAPQLQGLSALRDASPGLSVGLVHHARKSQVGGGERLTDKIRNSSHFGAWYDCGLLLERKDEQSPVAVRVELRDLPAPEPFSFTVEDEFPGALGSTPHGYLRIRKTDRMPDQVEREAAAAKVVPFVREFLAENPGCSKREMRDGVGGRAQDVDRAFRLLVDAGEARQDEPEKRGMKSPCWLLSGTASNRVRGASRTHSGGSATPVSPLPEGEGHGTHSGGASSPPSSGHGSNRGLNGGAQA